MIECCLAGVWEQHGKMTNLHVQYGCGLTAPKDWVNLSLHDFRQALRNSYQILKPGGIFRCLVPDLEFAARTYLAALDHGNEWASMDFLGVNTLLGRVNRAKGIQGLITSAWGNSEHLWMWDTKSLAAELRNAGFVAIRPCKFGDCEDSMFRDVENEDRFVNAVAIECRK